MILLIKILQKQTHLDLFCCMLLGFVFPHVRIQFARMFQYFHFILHSLCISLFNLESSDCTKCHKIQYNERKRIRETRGWIPGYNILEKINSLPLSDMCEEAYGKRFAIIVSPAVHQSQLNPTGGLGFIKNWVNRFVFDLTDLQEAVRWEAKSLRPFCCERTNMNWQIGSFK